MRVSRPASSLGLRTSISRSRSSASSDGPHFMPMGLTMPRQNSTCAPSSWRVRSPIHRKWPEVATYSPEPMASSLRVRACS